MRTGYSSVLLAALTAACASSPTVREPAPDRVTAVRIDTLQPMSMSLSGSPVARGADYIERRAEWPGPNTYRSANGAPGRDYWQQRVDYRIRATLDTVAQQLSGLVTIDYTNNSPDTLRYVWLQLDQNLYREGSMGSRLFAAESRWGVRGFRGGYDLSDVKVNGRNVEPRVHDTMMRLDLPQPLAPKGRIGITMSYRFRIPEHGSDRMGRDGAIYEFAQWYPRMAVFDDVRGWNTDLYLGQGEFYLEYGDISFTVTVPASFTVAATGSLMNAREVLNDEQRSRLSHASRTSEVVQIITADEAMARPTAGMKTWQFRALRVRDVAWAAAPDFRWDATSWNGILAQAFYQWPKAGKPWESAAEMTQWTIRHYSQTFFPYPYPQATTVAGPVSGMEYPMLAMVATGENEKTVFSTINHEHGHEWFPMIVGSNERRYAWMDEGFNTYINAFAKELRWQDTLILGSMMENWKSVVDAGTDVPMMTAPDDIPSTSLGPVGYRKPAIALLTLRNNVVGPALFDGAFREYIRTWAFKHPTPADFFRTIESATGRDLSWYWRGFWYTTSLLDIGIDSVSMSGEGNNITATIALYRATDIVFPVTIRLKYQGGNTADFVFPENIWAHDEHYDAKLSVPARVIGARLWPDPSVPDWNHDNDTWGDAPPGNAPGKVTR
ncbi:MAG TPA: M1 family metallopeptidase [Gemmatimonadaceae bacterium]|jgi:hypothetical protein